MAIDTLQKRRSMMNLNLPFRQSSIPLPDGAIGRRDRAQLIHLCTCIVLSPAVTVKQLTGNSIITMTITGRSIITMTVSGRSILG